MHFQTPLLAALSLALLSTARTVLDPFSVEARSSNIVCNGELSNLTCYKGAYGTPQNVNVSDVAYIASYLRAYGAQTRAGRLFTMSTVYAPNCAEWTLYQHGSALATAKHIKDGLNSSVLYSDIANTIDGGAGATKAQQAKAILGCGTNGGSLATQYNASNPAYNSTLSSQYPVGYTPNGILIKIVASNATVSR